MSGRSAYVRAKNHQQHSGLLQQQQQQQQQAANTNPSLSSSGRQTSFNNYADFAPDEPFLYGYSGPSLHHHQQSVAQSYGSPSPNSSFVANPPPPHIRRRSQSSTGSSYSYPNAPHLHKPRPIVIASAIEKSDFRTHLDGMSSHLRGKLGGLMKSGKKDVPPGGFTTTASNTDNSGGLLGGGQQPAPSASAAAKSRLRPQASESEFDFNSHSTDFAPSVGAVPSLTTNSTAPSEGMSQQQMQQSQGTYSIPTRSRQPLQQEALIHKIRRFEGGGKLPQLGWKSLSNNPELWDERGDTFVYMYMRGSKTKPPPSFRINSQVIFESGSSFFVDRLCNIQEPPGWPKFVPHEDDQMDTDEPSSTADYYTSSFDDIRTTTFHDESSESEAVSRPSKRSRQQRTQRAPPGIQYELYIPWPGAETGIHSTIWHITTRNFFAVMYDASSLVGTTLLEALTKLFERANANPEYLDPTVNKVAWITDYILRHRFDDVRNNPSYAASLLAFSEMPDVRWREGYIEAFVHCVGMLDLGLQTIPEWRTITPHTKMFLQNAALEIEERIHRAQGFLASFDFTEMWPVTVSTQTQARGCFDRLRKWLCKYYENAFLHWPPSNEITWLTRDMVAQLANDFHGLYDYLVDRDLVFEAGAAQPGGPRWTIISRTGANFRADSYELPFTDILIAFDKNNGFPHIPHPYPITPPSAPAQAKPKSSGFTLKKQQPSSTATDHLAQTRRKALSYAEASNVYTLRDQYMHTDLVTNFIRFEQSDNIDAVDPFEARRGRWLLVYGVLQVLATISVVSPNLRYKDGAQYHVCPQMKGVVPWAERGAAPEEEAEHERSHCWVVPHTWGLPGGGVGGGAVGGGGAPSVSGVSTVSAADKRRDAHKPILWGQYGDGRSRGDENSVMTEGAASQDDPAMSEAAAAAAATAVIDPATTSSIMRSQSSVAAAAAANAHRAAKDSSSSTDLTPAHNPVASGGLVGSASSNRRNVEIEEWVNATNAPLTPSAISDPAASGEALVKKHSHTSSRKGYGSEKRGHSFSSSHGHGHRHRLGKKEREVEQGITATTTTTMTVSERMDGVVGGGSVVGSGSGVSAVGSGVGVSATGTGAAGLRASPSKSQLARPDEGTGGRGGSAESSPHHNDATPARPARNGNGSPAAVAGDGADGDGGAMAVDEPFTAVAAGGAGAASVGGTRAGGAGGAEEGLSKAEQRRRRAKEHGFSDYEPPREW